jgi:ribulose-phosphate 3-epimerase
VKVTVQQLLEGGPKLSVGLLAADLLNLGAELLALERAGHVIVHVDVMDGVFCPQFTVGPPIIKAVPETFIKDCHLMIDEPVDKLQAYVDAGAGIITCHIESTRHPHRVLQSLAGSGALRGIALNPGTPLDVVEPLIDDLELLLLLAINPGWSGQKFIPGTKRRVAAARELIGGRDVVLGVDGGVTKANIEDVASLRPDLVVSGSAIFDGAPPADNLNYMVDALRREKTAVGREKTAVGREKTAVGR